MTAEQRQELTAMADALELQVDVLWHDFEKLPHEMKLAIQRLQEGAMWIRKTIDRGYL